MSGALLQFQYLAERVGFEPTIPEDIPVFETGAFVRSAISPQAHSISQPGRCFKAATVTAPRKRCQLSESCPVSSTPCTYCGHGSGHFACQVLGFPL